MPELTDRFTVKYCVGILGRRPSPFVFYKKWRIIAEGKIFERGDDDVVGVSITARDQRRRLKGYLKPSQLSRRARVRVTLGNTMNVHKVMTKT
jgi:hypothetical protein